MFFLIFVSITGIAIETVLLPEKRSFSASLILFSIIIAFFCFTYLSSTEEKSEKSTIEQNNRNIQNALSDNFTDAKVLNTNKQLWRKGYFISEEKTYTFEVTGYGILLVRYNEQDVMRISGNDY